jgi:splicing factor 3A subunit 1
MALLAQRSKIAQAKEATISSRDATDYDEAAETPTQQSTLSSVEPPPPIQYINILAPSNLTPAQIETMQLVAQFAALDEKSGPFLQMLALREWHNPIFGFLQPRHGHFAYFSALVDAYRRILGLWTDSTSIAGAGFDRLVDTMANNVNACLELAAFRAEYDRDVTQSEKHHNEEAFAASQVDWHDFVVVETIDFLASEIVLPPPPPPPKLAVPKISTTKPVTTPAVTSHETMDESDDEDEGESIRVVPSYTPNVVSTGSLVKDRTHVIDPITGKSVPVADMPEHMRIQLLDPKWAEERRKFQEKQKDSNLVSGDVIANNLSRLAQARGIGEKVSRAVE